MATTVKITAIGNSVGIEPPREVLNRLHVEKGDTLFVTDTPDGVRLFPYNVTFAQKLEALEQIMRENRDVLKKLAE
ncbi:AbrB/MazE/SpoVT family DNA-binding domain-containing protein [Edaphobacter sp.]|uniref:AbrB/MazE/SpoVT family DNA-binding domain-containing protein n=1 Tax=Edaphobacter sp. TaxID=1934404 RepID=UPI002DBC08B2|nr:AbrB/MazE/SpoVT family DNA-binding domain-containing protein [Edaphobacter sp.]HEU5342496.1 AbrB/MazE/SpoVT family DNA-binding domain-containing protein [Edaphobacter sp.]